MAAMGGQGQRGRSPLYRWFWDHHAELTRDGVGRADWALATKELAALGLANVDGSALTPAGVRKTWQRMVRDRAATLPMPLPSQPVTTRAALPAADPRYTFGPAKLRT